MERKISVDLGNLILSFSDSMDLASPELTQHQQRTALIVWEICKLANLSTERLENIFTAALIHDIGAFSLEEKASLMQAENINTEEHCIRGQKLLRKTPWLRDSARIIRYHHTPIREWNQAIYVAHVFDSQILYLSDYVERQIDRNQFILYQHYNIIEKVKKLSGVEFHPQIVELFLETSDREEFWLDLISPRLYSILQAGPFREIKVNMQELMNISELFRNIIDLRSRFTSTHSSGVAAASSKLAEKFGFTQMEIDMMQIAGNLHDIGKLAIPNEILNKRSSLTRPEIEIMKSHTYYTYTIINKISGLEQIARWAAYHHEKLDGSGYPFRCRAKELSSGARIMAVADIFTALAENRPYRKGMDQKEIVRIMRQFADRSLIDSKLVRLLLFNYDEVLDHVKTQQRIARNFYENQFEIKDVQ
ncbi:MAG: HD domain-containing protein [Candidatus Cloacimonetes bacterium]|nr:HD domain-containing protein [Candidatus Cloacimonadota bacterium]MCF7813427.1 HD domain-containing protein [Candidatus Cloacimonadota bacterium]MCF7867720.1 HD domain-containing protein [Candidatus Cloacimonadota bacterium]MCF7883194.1 HD domain-containing protein [Candidatus Cloacimonadota bacterium]